MPWHLEGSVCRVLIQTVNCPSSFIKSFTSNFASWTYRLFKVQNFEMSYENKTSIEQNLQDPSLFMKILTLGSNNLRMLTLDLGVALQQQSLRKRNQNSRRMGSQTQNIEDQEIPRHEASSHNYWSLKVKNHKDQSLKHAVMTITGMIRISLQVTEQWSQY